MVHTQTSPTLESLNSTPFSVSPTAYRANTASVASGRMPTNEIMSAEYCPTMSSARSISGCPGVILTVRLYISRSSFLLTTARINGYSSMSRAS